MEHVNGKAAADFDIQLIDSRAEIDTIAAEWRAFLREDAKACRLRQDPLTVIRRLERSPHESPAVLLVRKAGRLQCVAVCITFEQRFKLNLSVFRIPTARVRILKVVDSDFVYAEDADERDCVARVFAELERRDNLFDLIYLEDLRVGGPIDTHFKANGDSAQALRLMHTSSSPQCIHRHVLGDSYDSWLMSLNKKTRKSIRQRYRRLNAAFDDEVEVLKFRSVEQVPEFQRQLNDLYPKTWQAKALGPKQRRIERDTEIFADAAVNGWFRCYTLMVKGEVVAYDIGYQFGGVYTASEGGYDPELASWGVGSVLLQLILQDLYENDSPQEYDLGFGDNVYKSTVSTIVDDATRAYVVKSGLASMLIRTQVATNRLEKAVRVVLSKTGLVAFVRNIVKRKPK